MLKTFAPALCLVVSFFLLLVALLPGLPPPTYDIWKARLASAEWGTWALVLSLIAICLTLVTIQRTRLKWLWIALPVLVASVFLFMIPITETWAVASKSNIQLSIPRYFFGMNPSAEVQRDLQYADGLTLDAYFPPGYKRDGSIPAILVIHGGGWNHGQKSDYEKCNKWLSENGYAVFDMDYRLAGPQTRYPAQAQDVEKALHWLSQNALKFGIDSGRIALMGRSAGGQLALLTAYQTAGNSALRQVQAVISLYGPSDLIWGYNNIVDPDVINSRFLLENYLGGNPDTAKSNYQSASPLFRVGKTSPPTMLIHGTHDHLVGLHHTQALKQALGDAGVPVEVLELPAADHAFDYNFDGWNSQIEQAAILRFLQKYFPVSVKK